MWFGTEIRSLFQGNVLLAQVASSHLRVLGHICLFPSKVYENGTDAATGGAMEAAGRSLSPFKQTGPSRAPTRRAQLWACALGLDGSVCKAALVGSCREPGAAISQQKAKYHRRERSVPRRAVDLLVYFPKYHL